MIRIEAPFTEERIRALKCGDMVTISGLLYTGRDAVHKYLHEGGKSPVDLTDAIIYHCGPVVVKNKKGEWEVKAAGPTTSAREEPFQGEIFRKYRMRGVIGKGGMGPKTLAACKEVGACYFHAIGGAAQVLAEKVVRVRGVHFLEKFGSPEAIWELEMKDFPAVVTMDSHGNSLHATVLDDSKKRLDALLSA